jgi:thiol-disulfide isomerase/thioredoxin
MVRGCRASAFRAWLLVLPVLALAGELQPAEAAPVTSITVDEAADRVLSERGRVTVVLLWASTCPNSRRMLPEFAKLAEHYSSRGVSILAFSTDDSPDNLQSYLDENPYLFLGLHIKPWNAGELSAAMGRAQIEIGSVFGLPLVVVLDRTGRRVGQQSGGRGAVMAAQWLESLGLD